MAGSTSVPTTTLQPIGKAASRALAITAQVAILAMLVSVAMNYSAVTCKVCEATLLITALSLAYCVGITVGGDHEEPTKSSSNRDVTKSSESNRSVRRAKDDKRVEMSKELMLHNELETAAKAKQQERCDDENTYQEPTRQVH